MQALISVRSVAEALQAAAAGVRLIDLKEPRSGALGALPDATLCAIVQALHAQGYDGEISATTGDHPPQAEAQILAEVQRVAACGVDVVKVGVLPGPGGLALIETLSRLRRLRIVPVLMVDQGLTPALALATCAQPFHAVMIDTVGKGAGSVLGRLDTLPLRAWVQQARSRGRRVGLAGALQLHELPALLALGPDFAGFRSAVCAGDRGQALDPLRLQTLMQGLRGRAVQAPHGQPHAQADQRDAHGHRSIG